MRLYTHTHTHTSVLTNSSFKGNPFHSRNGCNRGISLIALIITIIVIIILAAISIAGVSGVVERSRYAKFCGDLDAVQDAVSQAYGNKQVSQALENPANRKTSEEIYQWVATGEDGATPQPATGPNGEKLYQLENKNNNLGLDLPKYGDSAWGVDPKTGEVYLVDGFEYDGNTYYSKADIQQGPSGNQGGSNTPTPPKEANIKVELTVDEERVTTTTIPVTAKVTKKDSDDEVTEGITYEFYKNTELDTSSNPNDATHTFNNLSETEEYTIKVVAKDASGGTAEASVTVGEFHLGGEGPYFRYTLGMTWGDFLDSKYPKKFGENESRFERITINAKIGGMYVKEQQYEVIGNSNGVPLCAFRHENDVPNYDFYIAVPDCAVGTVVNLGYYPVLDGKEYTPLEVYMRGWRRTSDYHDHGILPNESDYGLIFNKYVPGAWW